jgi:hypothetical protein
MKKLLIFIMLFSCGIINAQEQQETAAPKANSSDRLPVAGDISFGIDVLPYLNYLGNMFNNTAGNTLNLGNNNIYLRYFLSDNLAIRAILNIGESQSKVRTYVQDDAAVFVDPLSQDKVIDVQKTHNQNYGIDLGIMKFRGYDKLRGFYGAQINFGFNRNVVNYEYGNEMTPANPSPTSIWGNVLERTLMNDNGVVRFAGLGAFIGAEYYFLPKICIGAEGSLSYTYSWGSQSNRKTELIQNGNRYERNILNSPGDRNSNLNTFRPSTYGGLYIMFNF